MLSRVNKFKLNKINLCRLYRSATDNIPLKVEEPTSINNANNNCYKKELDLLISYQMETTKYLKHISQDINDSTHKIINKLEYANDELYYISRAIPIIQMIIGTLILIKI